MSLLVDKRLLTSLNNTKKNERNRMKYTELPGLCTQSILKFRLKWEPTRNVFLHAHENINTCIKKNTRSQRLRDGGT